MSNGNFSQVLVIGGGSGGIAAAASLLKRDSSLSITLIEPSDHHYYQPGWTMVGGGIFDAFETERTTESVIPNKVNWIRSAVKSFDPENNIVNLIDGTSWEYEYLVIATGLNLKWDAVEGLEECLGNHGVTSNYRFDLAPYTWELVKNLRQGTAIFTQPPMPIKCAGAPQKAMYLSCSHWQDQGVLTNINVAFHNAGGALFGVSDYVPALMEYVNQYGADLCFNQNLVAVDGAAKTAWFDVTDDTGNIIRKEQKFDMLHVCPPQASPDIIAKSILANDGGWLDVNQHDLQHNKFDNIFGIGDVISAPNAKTAAAVRTQAPILANNLITSMQKSGEKRYYHGYGSCPLTVEHGKIVLAEFGYGGKIIPTFPTWLINGLKPGRLAWVLKKDVLPKIYWDAMLKGREWLTKSSKEI